MTYLGTTPLLDSHGAKNNQPAGRGQMNHGRRNRKICHPTQLGWVCVFWGALACCGACGGGASSSAGAAGGEDALGGAIAPPNPQSAGFDSDRQGTELETSANDSTGGATEGPSAEEDTGPTAESSTNEPASVPRGTLHGQVQKGPMQPGSLVLMQWLSESLVPTGHSSQAAVTDAAGTYTMAHYPVDQWAQALAQGRYVDEITGQVIGPVTLSALVTGDVEQSAGINVLTHLQSARTQALVAQGEPRTAALNKARSEVLASLGLDVDLTSFSSLDLARAEPGDEVLLFASAVVLQVAHLRDPEQLADAVQTVLAEWSEDLAMDGQLDSAPWATWVPRIPQRLDEVQIRRNLIAAYERGGMLASPGHFAPLLESQQQAAWRLERPNGIRGQHWCADADGGFVALLYSADGLGALPATAGDRGYVARVGDDGQVQDAVLLDSAYSAQALGCDGQGRAYVLGRTSALGPESVGFVALVDAQGLQWRQALLSTEGQVLGQAQGGVFVATLSMPAPALAVRNYDAAGQLRWETLIPYPDAPYAGGKLEVTSHALVAAPDGGVFVLGQTQACLTVAGGAYNCQDPWYLTQDAFAARIAVDGTLTWLSQWGTPGTDAAWLGAADEGGNLIVQGYVDNLDTDTRANQRLLKFSPSGVPLWDHALPEGVFALAVAGDGLFLAGSTRGALDGVPAAEQDAWLARLDLDGDPLWLSQFGWLTMDTPQALVADADRLRLIVAAQATTRSALAEGLYGWYFPRGSATAVCDQAPCLNVVKDSDGDGDGVTDSFDLCPAGADQLDEDGDRVPDACDRCPSADDHQDQDRDQIPDACDPL